MAVNVNSDHSYKPLLSTETKSTIGNDEGDMILEIDTGDVYFWHVVDNVGDWYKLGEELA